MNTRGLWMGRPLEDLTQEELREAVVSMGEDMQQMRKTHRKALSISTR